MLLEQGANTEIRDNRGKGKTALQWAEIKEFPRVAQILVHHSCDAPSSEEDNEIIAGMARIRTEGQQHQVTDTNATGLKPSEDKTTEEQMTVVKREANGDQKEDEEDDDDDKEEDQGSSSDGQQSSVGQTVEQQQQTNDQWASWKIPEELQELDGDDDDEY